jgi:hypothetical protein
MMFDLFQDLLHFPAMKNLILSNSLNLVWDEPAFFPLKDEIKQASAGMKAIEGHMRQLLNMHRSHALPAVSSCQLQVRYGPLLESAPTQLLLMMHAWSRSTMAAVRIQRRSS